MSIISGCSSTSSKGKGKKTTRRAAEQHEETTYGAASAGASTSRPHSSCLQGVTSTPRSVSRNSLASTAGGNCSSSAAGDAEEGGGSGAPKTRINIVLLGKAGNGKSSFGNFLLNSQVFSITPGTECELKELETHSVVVRILDTPGLLGLDCDSVSILKGVGREIMRHMGTVHAFAFVLRSDTFISREDLDSFNVYKNFFGNVITNHCLIAFSRVDNLKRDLAKYSLSTEDYFRLAPQRLRNILDEVGRRYAFFGSAVDSQLRTERDSFLQFIDQMSRNPYKREYLYQQKQLFLNELRRKELQWREDLKKKAADDRAKENKRELELRDEMMRRVAHSALREREISTKVYHLVDDEITRIHDTDACSIM